MDRFNPGCLAIVGSAGLASFCLGSWSVLIIATCVVCIATGISSLLDQ